MLSASLTTVFILTEFPLKEIIYFHHHANVKGGPENLRSFPEVTQMAWQGGGEVGRWDSNPGLWPTRQPSPGGRPMRVGTAEGDQGLGMGSGG